MKFLIHNSIAIHHHDLRLQAQDVLLDGPLESTHHTNHHNEHCHAQQNAKHGEERDDREEGATWLEITEGEKPDKFHAANGRQTGPRRKREMSGLLGVASLCQ